MGFSVGAAQCLVAPPYALAAIVMYATGYLGDKYHLRGPIILCNMVLCLIGLPIMGWHSNPNVRYVSLPSSLAQPIGLTLAKVLWCFPNHCRSKQQHSRNHGLPSQQHQRPMEACFLLGHPGRYGRSRRYCWRSCIPRTRQARIRARTVCLHCVLPFDHGHCLPHHPEVAEFEQACRSRRDRARVQ